jgi:hypothetical protein
VIYYITKHNRSIQYPLATNCEILQVNLKRCNVTLCLPATTQFVYGLKGATTDMFLDNTEYRKFLFREFGVSTIDEESAAVVMVRSKFYCIMSPNF